MPLAMCASTGGVPQWYMKTPGVVGTEPEVQAPAARDRAERPVGRDVSAAWKSIEWGIAPPFTSVTSTQSPWRTWMTGPGAPPSNVQPR